MVKVYPSMLSAWNFSNKYQTRENQETIKQIKTEKNSCVSILGDQNNDVGWQIYRPGWCESEEAKHQSKANQATKLDL